MPASVVLDVPPLDLQGVGRRPRPTEGACHLYILTAFCCDVMRHLCKESCEIIKKKKKKERVNMMCFSEMTEGQKITTS